MKIIFFFFNNSIVCNMLLRVFKEKSCWELGVEPYKCDNSRLLQECNQLHTQSLKQQEEYEEKIQGKFNFLLKRKSMLNYILFF